MYKFIVFAVILAVLTQCGRAYRILCPYPANSRSHFIVAEALFKGLAAKGHDVTVISAFPPDKPIPIIGISHWSWSPTTMPGDMGISTDLIKSLAHITMNETRNMLQNPEVKKIMVDESFDLVIMEFIGEPHVGLSAHFNCPVILFSSVKPGYHLLDLVGNPYALSYVKNSMYPWADLNRLQDRLLNFVFFCLEQAMGYYLTSHYSAFHNEQFPPPKYPSYNDVLNNNVAAIFATQHFSQNDVRPLVPGLIEISGIQMTETPSPLPDALQSWMDQSTNGVIFFSLGSNLKVASLTPDMLRAIINAFKNLKQNVLWKADVATIPGLPSNVRLEKWVSQIDVLQHKNIQLFITHGGFGSISESKFYGVPVLVIPMFADQIPNAELVIAEGWGVKLLYDEFTEERFVNSLSDVLENEQYTNKAKYESMLFRDRPMTPLQTGIYWVEYIIRHKGAHHMRTNAKHLNWFQLHSVDVIGFLSFVIIIWMYVSYKLLKCLGRKIFCSKKSKLKTK